MNRREYLAVLGASLVAVAGCADDGESTDGTPDSDGDDGGEVVLREVIGSNEGMGGGGGMGGGNNGRAFAYDVEAGDQFEIEIDDRGNGTELELRAPDGEMVVERSIAKKETVTHEAEQDGEYTVRIVPDPSAEVRIVIYPPEAGDEA